MIRSDHALVIRLRLRYATYLVVVCFSRVASSGEVDHVYGVHVEYIIEMYTSDNVISADRLNDNLSHATDICFSRAISACLDTPLSRLAAISTLSLW